MIDSYWQWMTALCLAVAITFILAFPKLRRARPMPEPDVATEATREPMERGDRDYTNDEAEFYSSLYASLLNEATTQAMKLNEGR